MFLKYKMDVTKGVFILLALYAPFIISQRPNMKRCLSLPIIRPQLETKIFNLNITKKL